MNERCVCCGREIPEGQQVCAICKAKVNTATKRGRGVKDRDGLKIILYEQRLVTCKSCKYWNKDWEPLYAGDGSMEVHFCTELGIVKGADWFCADGEMNEDDE